MHPELLRIGSITIPSAAALMGAGVIVATLLAVRQTAAFPAEKRLTPVVGIWAYLGAVLGGRLGYALLESNGLGEILRSLVLGEVGSTSWGSLVGAACGGFIYLRGARVRLPFVEAAALGAPYLCLVEAFSRVGCFLNGCCWGERCAWPWAVTFPRDSFAYAQHVGQGLLADTAAQSLAVHPVQLYTAAVLLGAFFGLRALYRRGVSAIAVVSAFLLCYGATRFALEFFRADTQPLAGSLTLAQWLGLALIACGVAGLIFGRTRAVAAVPSATG